MEHYLLASVFMGPCVLEMWQDGCGREIVGSCVLEMWQDGCGREIVGSLVLKTVVRPDPRPL